MVSAYDAWRALSDLSAPSTSTKPLNLAEKGNRMDHRNQHKHDRDSEHVMVSPQCPAPSTPRKKQKYELKPHLSPGNPFRSPQKAAKHYEQMQTFPLRSTETNATYESDVSEPEENEQPAPLEMSATSTPVKEASSLEPISLYFTPRTKARKRLRGEDALTPPNDKSFRAPSQNRTANALIQSPRTVQVFDRRSFSRIFSASSEQDHVRELASVQDEDILGPSPVKADKQREFRPIFLPQATLPQSQEAVLDEDMSSAPTSPTLDATQSRETEPETYLSHPHCQEMALCVDDDADKSIKILPYRRFGSAKSPTQEPDDADLNFLFARHEESEKRADAGLESSDEVVQFGDRLTDIESHTLTQAVLHGQRVTSKLRERSHRMVQDLFTPHASGSQSRISTVVQRQGRAGLDTEEDIPSEEGDSDNEETHDDDWVSETSSVDYGWGDGDMDADDVE